LVDDAGDFESGDISDAGWRRIVTHPLHHVRAIHAGCSDFDEHFTRGRRRRGPFRLDKYFRSTGPLDFNRAHVDSITIIPGNATVSPVARASTGARGPLTDVQQPFPVDVEQLPVVRKPFHVVSSTFPLLRRLYLPGVDSCR